MYISFRCSYQLSRYNTDKLRVSAYSCYTSCSTKVIDIDDLDDIVGSKACWVDKVKKELQVQVEEENNLNDNLQEIVELMKTETLADKAAVIRLQSDLLKCKERKKWSLFL